jgi:hypothetical protein
MDIRKGKGKRDKGKGTRDKGQGDCPFQRDEVGKNLQYKE